MSLKLRASRYTRKAMEPDVATPSVCTYRFGAFSYDSRNRKLSRTGQAVRTTPKALHVLEVLLRAQGNLVSIDDLTSAVWPGVYVDRTTIHQNVATRSEEHTSELQ